MKFSVDEDVPLAWNHLIETFLDLATELQEEYNEPEIWDIKFFVKRGLLCIDFKGGSKVTDFCAHTLTKASGRMCSECSKATNSQVFGLALCDQCR